MQFIQIYQLTYYRQNVIKAALKVAAHTPGAKLSFIGM